jgi:putative ABC transport system ATP-binding protein
MDEALIEFRNVSKHYHMGDSIVKAIDNVSFKIFNGEFVAIVGQSGSGKSTCMNIIGCLDVPTDGMYLINGRNVGEMNKNELSEIRNEMVGFIFQQYNLLPKLNVIENVKVPLMYGGVSKPERQKRATEILTSVGLGDKLKHHPNQLSGGQQQRVSVARALVGNPAILLADEPTGALDSRTGREVLGLFQSLHQEGHTIVLITHDNAIAATAERIIRLEDGQIVYDGPTDKDKLVHPEIGYAEEGGVAHESA